MHRIFLSKLLNPINRFAVALRIAFLLLVVPSGINDLTGAEEDGEQMNAHPTGVGQNGIGAGTAGLNHQADLFSGSFTYGVPIAVPPARQGSEPKLALTYNSSAANGWCGLGWSLQVGFTERDTRQGVPVKWTGNNPLTEYTDDTGFVFALGQISGQLVSVGTDEYRSDVERNFLRFTFNSTGNFWEVTDQNGTKYFFGEHLDNRM